MTTQLCEHGCGQIATHQTKSSMLSGPFGGRPVWQCAKSPNSCPAVKKKKEATSMRNYGTPYPQQNKEHMAKINAINIEKYGHACSFKNPEQQAKRKATMMERYGVEQPTLNKEIRKKAAAGVKQSYVDDPTYADRIIQTRKKNHGANYAGIVAKTKATQIANGRWVDPSLLTEWQAYKRSVRYHSKKNYQLFKHIINPSDLPTGVCKYQVDHLYSIRHGFENKVDPKIVGHQSNLRMLWHTENKSKHIRSDITLEDLLQMTKGT